MRPEQAESFAVRYDQLEVSANLSGTRRSSGQREGCPPVVKVLGLISAVRLRNTLVQLGLIAST